MRGRRLLASVVRRNSTGMRRFHVDVLVLDTILRIERRRRPWRRMLRLPRAPSIVAVVVLVELRLLVIIGVGSLVRLIIAIILRLLTLRLLLLTLLASTSIDGPWSWAIAVCIVRLW